MSYRVLLAGCRSEPLGSYLQALGVLRAVARQRDPDARGCWRGGRFVLESDLDESGLIGFFANEFRPSSIVSPWSEGSGFGAKASSKSARGNLQAVRRSTAPRLDDLRHAILAAEGVIARGQSLGWGGSKEDLWDKHHKADVLRLSRAWLPDAALPWLDATVALAHDEQPTYSRLLGTGANFGRQDLSATYVKRLLDVMGNKSEPRRSESWLGAALFAREGTPYQRDTVGQFDPGRAGGVQSSPYEKSDEYGFSNPWSFLLSIEGTLLFAGAVVRRLGANNRRAAIPFMVSTSGVGFAGSAENERPLGEIWTPEWSRPIGLAELEQLISEGRAEWSNGPARSGVDFARAVASLGVDRGIDAFTRYVFAERLGQSPLAVPVGRVEVTERPPVRLTAQLDRWLARVRPGTAATGAAVRGVEAALYDVATDSTPDRVLALLTAVGELHAAVGRSSRARKEADPPLFLGPAAEWLAALPTDVPEVRVAAGLASLRDTRSRHSGLRALLTPARLAAAQVQEESEQRWPVEHLTWQERARVPFHPADGEIVAALAECHRWRSVPGIAVQPVLDDLVRHSGNGTVTAYARGLPTPLSDVVAFGTGTLDSDAVAAALAGLLLLDWSRSASPWPEHASRDVFVPPILALVLPFFASEPLDLTVQSPGDTEARDRRLLLRPGTEWAAMLRAGDVASVTADAVRRLRIAGLTPAVKAPAVAAHRVAGDLLAATTLLPIRRRTRIALLRATTTDVRSGSTTRESTGGDPA